MRITLLKELQKGSVRHPEFCGRAKRGMALELLIEAGGVGIGVGPKQHRKGSRTVAQWDRKSYFGFSFVQLKKIAPVSAESRSSNGSPQGLLDSDAPYVPDASAQSYFFAPPLPRHDGQGLFSNENKPIPPHSIESMEKDLRQQVKPLGRPRLRVTHHVRHFEAKKQSSKANETGDPSERVTMSRQTSALEQTAQNEEELLKELKTNLDNLQLLHHKLHAMLDEINAMTATLPKKKQR